MGSLPYAFRAHCCYFCLFVLIGQSQDNEKELAALFQLWLETKDQAFCKVCCKNLLYGMLLRTTSSLVLGFQNP